MIYMDGEENGSKLRPFIAPKKTKFNYKSLDDALLQIYNYEINEKHHIIVPSNDYDNVFYCREMRIKTSCIQAWRNELLAKM